MPFAIESIARACNCERSSRRRSARCAQVGFDPSVDATSDIMHTNHEVISAFLDDEPFEPQALADALADPAGRGLLIDFVFLRPGAESKQSAPARTPPP